MKAFGLGLQFNRHSPLSDERFEQFHTLVGNNPVLVGDEAVAAYKQALLDARVILQDAYQFDADLVATW